LGNEANAWGEVFQIATNREHTSNELVKILGKELEKRGDSGILVSGGLPVLCVGNLLWNGSKAEGAHTRGVSSFESGS
jgi:hypothetical protein